MCGSRMCIDLDQLNSPSGWMLGCSLLFSSSSAMVGPDASNTPCGSIGNSLLHECDSSTSIMFETNTKYVLCNDYETIMNNYHCLYTQYTCT